MRSRYRITYRIAQIIRKHNRPDPHEQGRTSKTSDQLRDTSK